MELVVTRLGPESAPLLRNLFEHYVHDMSEFFDVHTQEDGSYSYDVTKFWTDGNFVYLARSGEHIVGFAIVLQLDAGPNDMREFFILRRFRRSGAGRQLAEQLWTRHPGEWQVRVLDANRSAVSFWRSSIVTHTHGQYAETHSGDWRVFHFGQRG